MKTATASRLEIVTHIHEATKTLRCKYPDCGAKLPAGIEDSESKIPKKFRPFCSQPKCNSEPLESLADLATHIQKVTCLVGDCTERKFFSQVFLSIQEHDGLGDLSPARLATYKMIVKGVNGELDRWCARASLNLESRISRVNSNLTSMLVAETLARIRG